MPPSGVLGVGFDVFVCFGNCLPAIRSSTSAPSSTSRSSSASAIFTNASERSSMIARARL